MGNFLNPGFGTSLVTAVVPVALYFLALGMLNSRRHPQMLTGRQDFTLLNVTLCPLVLVPLMDYLRIASPLALLGGAALVAVACWFLSPRGGNWVVYNLPMPQARRMVERCLDRLGVEYVAHGGGWRLPREKATLQVRGLALLRNASIRLRDAGEDLEHRFEHQLATALADVRVETHPSTVALLLVATAMLVAPVLLAAQRVPQIVRILTDLLP